MSCAGRVYALRKKGTELEWFGRSGLFLFVRHGQGRRGSGPAHESDEDDDGQYVGNDQQKLEGDIKPYALKSEL